MQHVSVYRRSNGWFLNPSSLTTTKLWQGTPPYVLCAATATAEELGRTILDLFPHSKDGLPHPTVFDAPREPMKLAGVRSWTAFVRGTMYVGVDSDGELITFAPSRNAGPQSGFLYGIAGTLKIPANSTPEEIGETLIKTLASCL
jgi:hypothetical protein